MMDKLHLEMSFNTNSYFLLFPFSKFLGTDAIPLSETWTGKVNSVIKGTRTTAYYTEMKDTKEEDWTKDSMQLVSLFFFVKNKKDWVTWFPNKIAYRCVKWHDNCQYL